MPTSSTGPAQSEAVGTRRRWLAGVILTTSLLFLVVHVHTPISVVLTEAYDDGLFISLGRNLAEGNWLGRYNHLTLAKGPGYPLFLAIGSWLGLSASLMHALFHCAAVGTLAWVVARLSGSYFLALVVFSITLWHPVFFSSRILRDAIYSGQVLLILASVSYGLLVTHRTRDDLLWGSFAGAMLGWFWLTREEGVWVIPGIAVILFAAAAKRRATRPMGRAIAPLAAMVLVFLAIQVGFRLANWSAYGSFVGVDFKEHNFLAALAALQNVRDGEQKPYLPVSRSTRERIYPVSPSFASLRDFLDPPGGSPWGQGCRSYPWTCGDIGGYWFVWALRDAVAVQGHYQSPAQASAFYGTLAGEIAAACRTGELECRRSVIPYMPHVTRAQLGEIPARMMEALRWVAVRRVFPMDEGLRWGGADELLPAMVFLNVPWQITPSVHGPQHFKFSGWYHAKGDAWFTLNVVNRDDTPASVILKRYPSPDLATWFKDPDATRQRFTAEVTSCETDASLVLTAAVSPALRVPISAVLDGTRSFTVGPGTLAFDTAVNASTATVSADLRVAASKAVRATLLRAYGLGSGLLLGIGFVAFVGRVVVCARRRSVDTLLTLAAAAWVLAASRVVLIVLVDISSFPAVHTPYLTPACFLSCVAAILSIGAWVVTTPPERGCATAAG